jgi:exodeoxyribonuclease VII large subunit
MSGLFDLPFEAPEPGEEAGPEARPAPSPPAPPVLSVSELTAAIRDALETRFADVWVEGEISNCRPWHTGHLYFTLKDPGAQIKAVMFRSALRDLPFKPADGLKVVARGRVGLYDPKGEYQLICERMEPQGVGALQLAFEQLKKRLQAEGLFAAERKRKLPALPRKIGIVTSLDGAALRDIIKVISRRHPKVHLVIRPTRVQGEGASFEVARAIQAIARVPMLDVLIVGRGGGSIEDLWAFNEERVARAIARCPVPVISAVGHETDMTIADFVADLRAPTPSAAAEVVVAGKDEFSSRIDRLVGRLRGAVRSRLERAHARVHELAGRPGLAGYRGRMALRGRHVVELTHQMRRAGRAFVARRERRYHGLRLALETFDLRRRLGGISTRLARVDSGLLAATRRRLQGWDLRLRQQAARLETLSPLAVLGRGYSVCWDERGTRIIRDASTVSEGDAVKVTLHRGELTAQVTKRS